MSAPTSDLELAAAVQQALLNIEIPQCRCGEMVLQNRMIAEVGGDFYHFRELGQDQIAFAIGDVMGHGAGAALIMSLIIGLLRADRTDNRRPDRIVARINDMLLNLGQTVKTPIICSLIYGIVDLPSGLLLYINAGHPHPIIYNRRANSIYHLPTTAMVLGVEPANLKESCHQFSPQDRLTMFTDGITETRNHRHEQFGAQRLEYIIQAEDADTPKVLAQKIFEENDLFSGQIPKDDDQTLVIVDFNQTISPGI